MGRKQEKRGRPKGKKGGNMTRVVRFRVTLKQWDLYLAAAIKAGISGVHKWVRKLADREVGI